MSKSITAVTNGQIKQVKRFTEDAVDCVIRDGFLDKNRIQKLIENGGKFQTDIIALIKKYTLANRFANEEVESSYGYPEGFEINSISEQVAILQRLFPGIGFANEKIAERPLPKGAEGWFAIPRWQILAPTYGEAVRKVVVMNERIRKDEGYSHYKCSLPFGPEYLRQLQETVQVFQKFGDTQKGYDILVVPANFGIRHRGRSVRRALEVMNANEVGLGTFAVGIMLLTNPKREVVEEQLHIKCAGDEFAPEGDGGFSEVPCFFFSGGIGIMFTTCWCVSADRDYGSASAFLPLDLLK